MNGNNEERQDKGQFVQFPLHLIYERRDLTRDDKWVLLAIMGKCWSSGPHRLSYREIEALSGVPITLLTSYQDKTGKHHEGTLDRLARLEDIKLARGKEVNPLTGKLKGQPQTYIYINYQKLWQQNVAYYESKKTPAPEPYKVNDGEYESVCIRNTCVSNANTSDCDTNTSVSITNESVCVSPSEMPTYITQIDSDITDTTDKEESIAANIDTSTIASSLPFDALSLSDIIPCFFCSEPMETRCSHCGKRVCSQHGTNHDADDTWCVACVWLVEHTSIPPQVIEANIPPPSQANVMSSTLPREGDMPHVANETVSQQYPIATEETTTPEPAPRETGRGSTRLQESEKGHTDATTTDIPGWDDHRDSPAVAHRAQTDALDRAGQLASEGEHNHEPTTNRPYSDTHGTSLSLGTGSAAGHDQEEQALPAGEGASLAGARRVLGVADENILPRLHVPSLLDHHGTDASNRRPQVDSASTAPPGDALGMDCATHGSTSGGGARAESTAVEATHEGRAANGQGDLDDLVGMDSADLGHPGSNGAALDRVWAAVCEDENGQEPGDNDETMKMAAIRPQGDNYETTGLPASRSDSATQHGMGTDLSLSESHTQTHPVAQTSSRGGSTVAVLPELPTVEPERDARDIALVAPVQDTTSPLPAEVIPPVPQQVASGQASMLPGTDDKASGQEGKKPTRPRQAKVKPILDGPPIMPPDDARWNDETGVQIMETKKGRRYGETTRKSELRKMGELRKIEVKPGACITRQQYEQACDELLGDSWWEEKGVEPMIRHMVKDERIIGLLKTVERKHLRLVTQNNRSTNGASKPAVTNGPTTNIRELVRQREAARQAQIQ